MRISTEDFRRDPGPFYRQFVLQIMEVIGNIIIGHTQNSDVHDYQYTALEQPEYVIPQLLAKVTQFTTFILPLGVGLDARNIFRRTL